MNVQCCMALCMPWNTDLHATVNEDQSLQYRVALMGKYVRMALSVASIPLRDAFPLFVFFTV